MRGIAVSILLCSLLSACDEELTTSGSHDDTTALRIALTGSDIRGQPYRLRSAEFEVSGCPDVGGGYPIGGYGGGGSGCTSTTLSSDDDLDAEFITRRFIPGSYNVTLRGDWYLEELKNGQADRVEKAILLSPQSQYAYLGDGWSQTIYFSFGIDGDIIDFRSGTLNIGIQVEKPGDHNCQPAGGGWGGWGGNVCNVSGSGGAGGRPLAAGRGSSEGTAGVASAGGSGGAGADSP